MILGGNELTMKELVALYAMLANDGIAQPLVTIRDDESDQFQKQLLSPEASFLVLDMLRKNPRPDSVPVHASSTGLPVAWKTGTSYAFRDAWTTIDEQYFVANPEPTLNLRKIDVCADTGDLPSRYCPRTVRSWFIPGKSPITVSNVHRAIRIDKASGKRSCSFDPDTTRTEVFEFWPSDILKLFREAGISIRRPPQWSDDCSMDTQVASGVAPQITSPSSGLTYYVRPDRIDDERIALEATTDGDVDWVYWFANDRFIAKVRRDDAYFWKPELGEYDILAVDGLGRGHSRHLSVGVAQ